MDSKLVTLYVNNLQINVPVNTTIIQACEILGIHIPKFCYHDLLEIAGNCRICLIEVEKSPKPQPSCSLPVADQIRVYTNTPLVKKAQESVLEFLLLNHPLDCPICDQGGECDLQNHAIDYGTNESRFYSVRRGVEDKGLGPIVKTVITRCIHCTRCIRFAQDIAGVEDLGATLRGNQTEVGTYVKKTFNSEVSGNIIDLCPVGALTSKPHAFQVRPWELSSIQSIDTSDCLGSNISIETKGKQAYRIVPKPNKLINQDWLSDKARFIYEGHSSGRLATPHFLRGKTYFNFQSTNNTINTLNFFFKTSKNLKIVFGRNVDLSTIKQGKDLVRNLGGDLEGETDFNIIPTFPAFYQSSISINDLSIVDSCFLLGVNPRQEATIFNLRLRSRFKAGQFKVISLGNPTDLTFPILSIGLQIFHCCKLIYGLSQSNLNQTKHPVFVYGDSLSKRNDSFSCLHLSISFNKLKQVKNWFGCFRLPLGSNSVGKAFYGVSRPVLKNYNEDSTTTIYFFGVENLEHNKNIKRHNTTCILETTHVSNDFKNCDFLLPQQSTFEKSGYFINYTGQLQKNLNIYKFGTSPNYYLKKFCSLKNEGTLKTRAFSFNSLVSTSLVKVNNNLKKIKIYTTPIKSLSNNNPCSDRVTNASLTLNKVSSNSQKIYFNFIYRRFNTTFSLTLADMWTISAEHIYVLFAFLSLIFFIWRLVKSPAARSYYKTFINRLKEIGIQMWVTEVLKTGIKKICSSSESGIDDELFDKCLENLLDSEFNNSDGEELPASSAGLSNNHSAPTNVEPLIIPGLPNNISPTSGQLGGPSNAGAPAGVDPRVSPRGSLVWGILSSGTSQLAAALGINPSPPREAFDRETQGLTNSGQFAGTNKSNAIHVEDSDDDSRKPSANSDQYRSLIQAQAQVGPEQQRGWAWWSGRGGPAAAAAENDSDRAGISDSYQHDARHSASSYQQNPSIRRVEEEHAAKIEKWRQEERNAHFKRPKLSLGEHYAIVKEKSVKECRERRNLKNRIKTAVRKALAASKAPEPRKKDDKDQSGDESENP